MPGANCVFPGCTVSRTDKHKDIGIFKVPTRKDEFHSDWRKNLINVITRYRENDTALKDQITAVTFIFVKDIFHQVILS